MNRPSEVEQLLCALIFMLTRQARNPGHSLAMPIHEHLQWLAEHPDTAAQPVLRKTCERLMLQWGGPKDEVGECSGPARNTLPGTLH